MGVGGRLTKHVPLHKCSGNGCGQSPHGACPPPQTTWERVWAVSFRSVSPSTSYVGTGVGGLLSERAPLHKLGGNGRGRSPHRSLPPSTNFVGTGVGGRLTKHVPLHKFSRNGPGQPPYGTCPPLQLIHLILSFIPLLPRWERVWAASLWNMSPSTDKKTLQILN